MNNEDEKIIMTEDTPQIPSIGKIADALAKAQAVITSPPRNREVTVKMRNDKGTYKFKYATLDSIIDHVRTPLTDNGLWFTQTLEGADDGKYRLVTSLIHSSGEMIKSVTPLLVAGGGNQEFGSALTYMRRYALSSLLGIAADEDDDANVADGNVATTKSTAKPKWAGPLAKMKLKNAFKDWSVALAECQTPDAIDALHEEYHVVLDQLSIDKPEWYHGTDDFDGVQTRVENRLKQIAIPYDQTIHAPIEGDWRDKIEAALDQCQTVMQVNALANANTVLWNEYGTLYPDKVKSLRNLFDNKQGMLSQAPVGDPFGGENS